MSMGLINDFDFKEYLADNIKGYKGQYSDQIRLLPEIYDLVCRLLESATLPLKMRADFFLAIGYLFYPNDLYSEEEHGAAGFIDDLMLLLVVLRKCSIQEGVDIDYLEKHSQSLNYSLKDLLTTDFDKITKENKLMFDELLSITGLRFYYKDY